MGNSTIKISLGTLRERKKIKDSVKPTISNIVKVNVSCSDCLKAWLKDDRVYFELKTGEVGKHLRFHPGYKNLAVSIYLVNEEGTPQTILLQAKVIV